MTQRFLMREANREEIVIRAQGPHDRNFLARINNENFLRGANERNTRLRQEVIFSGASKALRAV